MNPNKILLGTIVFLLMNTLSFSQAGVLTDSRKSSEIYPYEVSVFVGMASYEGDLVSFKDNDVNLFNSSGAAFGFNFNYNVNSNFGVGLGYRHGKIKGDDADADALSGRRARGFSFTNNLNEITLRVEYAPLGHKGYKLTPYVYSALGLLLSNPDINFNENRQSDDMKARIQKDRNEISNTSMVFPIGLGLKYQISDQFSLKAEAALRVGANDYLDGASHSASTSHKDYYGMGGVSVSYSFGKGKGRMIKEI